MNKVSWNEEFASWRITMVKVKCSVPNCQFETDDASEALVIAILANHGLAHLNSQPVSTAQAPVAPRGPKLERPKVDIGVTFWRTLLLDWLQLSTWNIRKYAMDLRINFGFESELWQEIWRTWQHEFDETQITGCLDWPQFSIRTSFILWRSLFPVELQDWTRAVWMKTWQWVSTIARIDSVILISSYLAWKYD